MVNWKLYIDSPQKRAFDFCGGSLTEGGGVEHLGGGYGMGFGYGSGDGYGDGYCDGYGCGWGAGGSGFGWGTGGDGCGMGSGWCDDNGYCDGGSETEW